MDQASIKECRQLCSDLEVSSQFQLLTQDVDIAPSSFIRSDRGALPFREEVACLALDYFAEARECEKFSDNERKAVMHGTFEMLNTFRELFKPLWDAKRGVISFVVSS